jgi:hypothetical protein
MEGRFSSFPARGGFVREEVVMATKKNDSSTRTPERKKTEKSPIARRLRKHGYQGYPVKRTAGGMHFGRGFGGVEPLGGGDVTLPKAGIFPDEPTHGEPDEPENQPAKG